MKLKIKILLAFLLLAQLPVLLTGFLSYRISKESLEQETVSFLVATNLLKSAQIKQWINDATRHIVLAASLPLVRGPVPGVGQAGLARAAQARFAEALGHAYLLPLVSQGRFVELYVLSPSGGEVLFSTDKKQEGKIKEDMPYFLQGREKTFVDTIRYSMTLQKPTLVISTPVRDKGGQLVAVLAGRLNLQELSAIMKERSGLRASEDTYLVNAQNYFITEPRYGNDYALRKTVYTAGVQTALQGRGGTAVYVDYRGAQVIGAYQHLPERNVAIITEVDEEEYLAPISRLRNLIFTIGSIVAIVSLLIGWLSAEALLQPLLRLVEAVKRMDADNLVFTETIPGTHEIAQLARAFASLAGRLQQSLVSRDALQQEIEIRKETERQLENTLVQLNRSNQELEQFAYVASHDLQEPLRMVASYVQLLAERYQNQLDEKAEKYIHYAVDGAVRMQALIKDLLEFSRVSTRGGSFAAVDCNELLALALDNLQTSIRKTGAVITADPLPVAWGDGVQIVQLFQNLIANAIKFCAAPLPTIHVGVGATATHWLMSVRDNGIGIDRKYGDKIFVIFQRLHTREEYQGTGIGLAVCKRIVERHGGEIWFESTPGQGTTFYWTLPKNQEASLENKQQPSITTGGSDG